jgi:hypothetical protein
VRRSTQSASLSSLLVLLCATLASAQGTTVNAVRGRISERMVVGSTTLGDVLRIVGSSTVSSGTGTMNPAVVDSDGDVLEDSFTTVSTAGAHTWGAAGSFTSTLGVTGLLSGNTGTLLLGSTTRITNTSPALYLHDSDASSSEKYFSLEANGGLLALKKYDDTPSSSNVLFQVDSTALVPDDWRWGSLLATIRPENNGSSTLGSLTKMYSAAYIWDLVAQTLTAKEVISTIGGEIIVAPTTSLTRDVASGGGFIYVKHNQLRTNDTVYLKVNASGEKMLVTGTYIDCSVSGNCISVASDYAYPVTRNRQGSGAKDWLAGAAVVNEGNVGDGNISIFADRSSSVSDGYIGLVVGDGPIAEWRMNETTSTTTADLMGNVGVATETGTQSTGLGTTGLANLGNAGADPVWSNTSAAGYLLVANDADLQITGDLTIEFLAYWQATSPSTQHIISRNHAGEFHVAVLSSGELQFCHGNTSTFNCYTTAAGVVTSAWTHYVIVRDAASSPKRLLFYKNGALIFSTTYTQAVTTTTNTLGIGQNPHNLGFGFDGWIDEVAIYNYQLAADRILLHHAARANDSISRFTIGPTLCGNVRTGTAAFDMAERWCLGNLAGTYGYSSVAPVYGLASGNASATWVSVDATNGFRIMNGSTVKTAFDTSGNGLLTGDLSIGTSGSLRSNATAYDTGTGWWIDYNGGTPRFRIGTTSASTSYLRWTGSALEMKSNTLTVDANGIVVAPNASASHTSPYGYKFSTAIGSSDVGTFSYEVAGGRSLGLINSAVSPGRLVQTLMAATGAGGTSSVRAYDDNAGGNGAELVTPNASLRLEDATLSIGTISTLQINGFSTFTGTCTGTITVEKGLIRTC